MNWRLIEQQAYSADMNMAIDHAIYESVANGRQLPTIRFYRWSNSSVSLGAYQNPKEINLNECKRNGIGVVRRMTGGRAVFHDKTDFTYSVITPLKVYGYSIESAYREICACMINALKELGIKSNLEHKNDIVAHGKKISGNAAKAMDKGIYLQHGTLVYDIDFEVMPGIMNISKEAAREKIASVLQFKKISQKKVYDALKNNFTANKEFKAEELSKSELMRAENLAETIYNTVLVSPGILLKNKGVCYVERGGQ